MTPSLTRVAPAPPLTAVEVDPRDRVLLDAIGRLRVLAWADFSRRRPGHGGVWLDGHDLEARHWAVFDKGEPVAAARMSVHQRLDDVPDGSVFAGVLAEPPAAPIASFNRMVVHPDFRGLGLPPELDRLRLAAAIEAGCRSAIVETHSGPSRVAQLAGLGFQAVGPSRPYPPAHFLEGAGVVMFRDLSRASLGRNCATANCMGWSSHVLSEIGEAFVARAARSSHPVMDIGAGFGLATSAALESGATVVANDVDEPALADLRARTPIRLRARLTCVPGRLPDAPAVPDGSFAAIHISQVLHFLTPGEVVAALARAARWLRPGGTLFVLAATPYQGTHAGFIDEFLRRKASGDRWPGLIEQLRNHNRHWSASLNPSWLHVFDDDVLSAAVREAGLVVESARLFSRKGIPDFCRLDGRENLGLIASKPLAS